MGGGLLGLEAAHALKELKTIDTISIMERNDWVSFVDYSHDSAG